MREILRYFKGFYKVIESSSKGVSRKIRGVSAKFQGFFTSISRQF